MVTATKLDRRPCVLGRWSALGIVCLIIGVCGTGCGKDEPEPPAPKPTGKTSVAARKAQPSATKTAPAASAATPAHAAPETSAPAAPETPEPAFAEAPVESPPAPAVERPTPADAQAPAHEPDTGPAAQEKETVVEDTRTVSREPEPAVEESISEPLEEKIISVAPARKPQTVDDYLELAHEAFRVGDCETALDHFSMARRLDPDDLEVRLLESEACRRCNQPERVLELLGQLEVRVRVLESFTYEIAESHLALNQPAKAAMAWELRYMQVPTAWKAAVEAAQAWLLAGHERPAQWWFEQARSAAPNTPEVEALEPAFQAAVMTD
jgi:hypothetical protein